MSKLKVLNIALVVLIIFGMGFVSGQLHTVARFIKADAEKSARSDGYGVLAPSADPAYDLGTQSLRWRLDLIEADNNGCKLYMATPNGKAIPTVMLSGSECSKIMPSITDEYHVEATRMKAVYAKPGEIDGMWVRGNPSDSVTQSWPRKTVEEFKPTEVQK